MSTTTSNYGLTKPDSTDNAKVAIINANFEALDTLIKKVSDSATVIQTAGGTGTAITLTVGTLSNGYSITFVASASNSGASTTINSIPLYKANTTSAPTLTAGKSYTVWYNSSSNCFFLIASAEGTATASDVLAGKTFSNDSDTAITGTIIDRGLSQYSTSIGIGTDYLAFEKIPVGLYRSNNDGWSPEIRCNFATVRTGIGLSADKLVSGNTILGLAGSATIQSLGGVKLGHQTGSTSCGLSSGYTVLDLSSLSFTPLIIAGTADGYYFTIINTGSYYQTHYYSEYVSRYAYRTDAQSISAIKVLYGASGNATVNWEAWGWS